MTGGYAPALAAVLRDETLPPATLAPDPAAFVRACAEDDLSCLVYEVIRKQDGGGDWTRSVRGALAVEARAQAAEEMLRRRELMTVLAALTAAGIQPVVIKGMALAYSVYAAPAARRCRDSDILVRRNEVTAVRDALARLGYAPAHQCDGELLFYQVALKRTDRFGLVHTLDVHWKISTQSLFAGLLTFDEIAASATALPALGADARGAGPLHALLLACVHPVMHHRQAHSLVWVYDVHLLASRLSASQFDRFADLALKKQVAAVCAHQLRLAARLVGTRIPDRPLRRLDAAGTFEASAAYLRPDRRWRDELVWNLQGLSSWRDRARLLREVAFPSPGYVLRAYRIASPAGAALLPALYLHRLATGGWKVITGRK
jgi:hypothetical protein